MTAIAYLAGPDVFLPNAVAHAATKVEICRRGKYPPAEPGALGIGPLEAAVRVADATLHSLAT